MDDFIQIVKVDSGELNGDEHGHEWSQHYVLYQTVDDTGTMCYDLFEDDGAGNGAQICRGYNLGSMRSLILRLGAFVEWSKK